MLREEADGMLVLTYDSARLSWFLLALAAGVFGLLVYEYAFGARSTQQLIGLVIGGGACVLAAVVSREHVYVVVDPRTRTVAWTRTWAFRRRSGSLPFDEVAAVLPERPLGDDGIPSRRIVLRTKDGRTIPLLTNYRTDGKGEILRASERINAVLGGTVGDSVRPTAEALVAAGRLMDAVALLREKEGLSLAEARERAEAFKRKP